MATVIAGMTISVDEIRSRARASIAGRLYPELDGISGAAHP